MKILVITALLVFQMIQGFCQSDKISTLYRCIVITNAARFKGVLYTLEDSAIQLMSLHQAKQAKKSEGSENIILRTIEIYEIKDIKFRKTGTIASGAIEGGGSGMVIGGALGAFGNTLTNNNTGGSYGSNSGFQFSPVFYVLTGAILGAPIGLGLGIMIGSSNKEFTIDGNLDLYKHQKAELEKYLFPLKSQIKPLIKDEIS